MMKRKELLKRVNCIAHARARAAYKDEKAKLLQDMRQAVADGQDLDAFLAELERAERRAYLLGDFDVAAVKRSGAKGVRSAAASEPAKTLAKAAPRARRTASTD